MRILCVCDHGSSRSVHIADQLRYRGHEAIPVGTATTSDETRTLLAGWADVVIFTDPAQQDLFPNVADARLWTLPDAFPRPYNAALLHHVRALVERSGL
jgi:hypothetical protein